MRGPRHPWGVIWCANCVFFWALYHWFTAVLHFSYNAGPDRIGYVTGQAFGLSSGFTWLWWYAYQKRKERAGGELPPTDPPRRTFLTREPFRRYRFVIIWAGMAAVVALVTLVARLVTGRPSLTALLLYPVILPSMAFGWMLVVNWASQTLFRRPAPETSEPATHPAPS